MSDFNDELNFILQCALLGLTIWAWTIGGGWRLLAGAVVVLAGVDGLIDIPEFIGNNDLPAAVVEVGWVFAAIGVIIYYIAYWQCWKQEIREWLHENAKEFGTKL